MNVSYECHKASDTERAGRDFAEALLEETSADSTPVFVAMFGEMGAGKTTFVRGMAEVVSPGSNVYSPTYSIINMYEGKRNFYHADLYRLYDEDDLFSSGFFEILDEKNSITVCEWCEKIPTSLPKEYYKVTISGSGDGKREIKIEKIGG